jgi:hypothetical protein
MTTVIRALLYVPETKRLTVAFVTRAIRVYEDVPPEVAEALLRSGWRTAFFNTYIRDRYQHRKAASRAA